MVNMGHDQQLTLGELCEAIADGRVEYTVEDGCYQVARRDVRRLEPKLELPLLDLLVGQEAHTQDLRWSPEH
jgi:hypothetical protein